MPPKLLMVVRPVAGGMWRHVLTLIDGLAGEYEIVVGCPNDLELRRDLDERGITHRVVGIPARISPASDARAVGALRRLFAHERPALVHAHGFHAGLLVSAAHRRRRGTARVCTLHTMAVPPGARWVRRLSYGILQGWLVRSTPHVIAVSAAVKNALPGGRDASNVSVIANGLAKGAVEPTMDLGAARSELGINGGAKVVGCVARLAPEKGVDDFLRMARIVADEEPSTVFAVVGDGPERPGLDVLVDELGLRERVRFVGRHFPAADFMQTFAVTVVPSRSEGQSLAAIESLFAGKPIVAAAVGGLTEVVTPDVGRLVPPGDPTALARAVAELLDSGEAQRMGERGRLRAGTRYTSENMVDRTKRVYEAALGKGGTK